MKLLLFLALFIPQLLCAQDFLSFLSPRSPRTTLDASGSFSPMADIEKGQDASQVLMTNLSAGHMLYEKNKDSLVVGARYQKLDFSDRDSRLRDFYNVQGSLGYKRVLNDDRFWSASLSYGSASDRPFQNGQDGTVSFNYLQKFNARWFGVLNYSNNRTFLNNIPLPGFFYVKEMSQSRALVLGFPLIYWMTPINDNFTIRYFGILPWSHKLRVLYMKWRFIRPYVGYDQSPDSYFRSDRNDKNDRIFWYEKRLLAGVEGNLNRGLRYDVGAGYAFDRQLFEARNFADTKNFLYNFDNAYFVSLGIRYNF